MKIHIDKLMAGHLTGVDLVGSTGTIEFVTDVATISLSKTIFEILYESFSFSLKFNSGEILIERCGNVIAHKMHSENSSEKIKIRIVFEPQKMGLLVGDEELFKKLASINGDEKDKFLLSQYKIIKYNPLIPPNSMFPWLRKQALLPKNEFSFYEEFLDAVAGMLRSIDSKIKEPNMSIAFWNAKSKNDPKGLPKIEIHIQPTLLGLMQDECLVKGLEISHEGKAGSGALDFYISGYIKNSGIKGICVEVKHAHSPKLEEGIEHQLPIYMKSKGSDFGFYLVLWCKCARFENPREYDDIHLMEDRLHLIRNSIGHSKTIRILTLDLTAQPTPSSL